MKKNLVFFLIIFILLSICSTCKREKENCHYKITVLNKTSKSIYIEECNGFPDTTYFKYEPNPVLDSYSFKVEAGETSTRAINSRDCIEYNFENLYKTGTMMIFVFDAQVLETTPWDTIKKKYMVLKRYDLSLEDLKRMNWTITYQ